MVLMKPKKLAKNYLVQRILSIANMEAASIWKLDAMDTKIALMDLMKRNSFVRR